MTDPRWSGDRGRAGHEPAPRHGRGGSVVAVSMLVGASLTLVVVGLIGLSRPGGPEPSPAIAIAPPSSTSTARAEPPRSSDAGSLATSSSRSVASIPVTAAGPPALAAKSPERNPINAGEFAIGTTTCALPAFDPSPAGQHAFFESTVACLDRAWKPVMESAQLPFRRPEVVSVTREVDTPCGPRSPNQTALYCDGTIYMTGSYYRDVEGHGDDAGVYFGQLAHEYGHHVQHLAGIMDISWEQRYAAGPDSRRGLEVSRRFELQATCYGGMFLGAVEARGSAPRELVESALTDAGLRGDEPDGDEPDHGTAESNGMWARQGYERNRTHQCNTWLADAGAVR